MPWLRALIIMTGLVASIATAAPRRSIPGQAASVPLTTALRVQDERAIAAALRFDHFDRAGVLRFRTQLAPLADAGDPLAQLYLARVYDLFPFGLGTPDDAARAITWYTRAADQHLAAAEHFLAQAYEHEHLGVPRDRPRAYAFLQRAYADSSGALRAQTCLALAGLHLHPDAPSPVTPDPAAGLAYLEEALRVEPTNQQAIDWLVDLASTRGDRDRLRALAPRSRNAALLERVAAQCLQAFHDQDCAIRLLRVARPLPREDRTPPEALLDLYTLVCRHQLPRKRLAGIDTPAAWAFFQQWQHDCVVTPGG